MSIWNWKSAVLGAAYRGPIFFFVSLKSGWRLAIAAMLAEAGYRAVVSGFWGAFAQALRLMQPAWAAVVLVAVVAPVIVQGLELVIHMANGTPNLMRSFWISSVVTGIAALFNLYVMQRGTLITGKQGHSMKEDLRHLPRLILGFLTAGPKLLWRMLRPVKPTTG